MSDVAVSSASYGMGRSGFPSPALSKPPSRGTPITIDRPATRGQMGTPSGERLTPMPEYMHPIAKSAARKWKKLHDDHMMGKLLEKRNEKKELNQVTRQEATRIARKIPMEILAKDWFKDNKATIETRAFLVDRVLPTLILGVEKLLMEVDRRSISDAPLDSSFNPVNFLAQYLMRNNPRYSNFSEASPYVRGLREVGEELRKQLFDIEENKLARIKAEARRKREEREHAEHMRLMEKQRRTEALRKQFNEWNILYYPNARIELALLQNALRSFAELTEQYPDDMRQSAQLSRELEPTDDTGKTVSVKEFVQYLGDYVEDFSAVVFNHFLLHLSHCALAYRIQAERVQRRVQLTQLFVSCDNTGVGLIDRHRILSLFEMFYDRARELVKNSLRNPRKWPVVDVNELDMASLNEEEDEKEEKPKDAEETEATTEADATQTSEGDATETKADDEGESKGETADGTEAADSTAVADTTAPTSGTHADGDVEPPSEQTSANEAGRTGTADTEGIGEEQKDSGENGKVDGNNPPLEGGVNLPTDGTTDQKTVEEDGEQKESGEEKADDAAENQHKNDAADGDTEAEDNAEVTSKAALASAEPTLETVNEEVVGAGKEDTAETSEKEKAAGDVPEKEADEAEQQHSATTTDDGEPELAQLLDSNDTAPPRTADQPPRTQQSKVSFAEGTNFERERTMMQSSRGSRSHSVASAFDENTLNTSQFVSVIETFLGDQPRMEAFHQLINYIREGYMETEDERMHRLIKARQEAQVAKRKALLNSLFEMWDNDGSGHLDLQEVVEVMSKYKEGLEIPAIETAKKDVKKKSKNHDNRFTKREFRDFVYKVVENMAGTDDFDYFVDFMLNSVERTYAERVRGEARKKWLQTIVNAGETSGVNMEPVYKAVFQSLYKDAEAHGNNKVVSAYLAMLERNEVAPSRGETLLRYVAATPDAAPYVLGKALFRDMRGISFASVDTGKPIHVPRVGNHGNIYFWNSERPEDEREGSFIVVPLKDRRKRVFGLLGMDTLNDPHSRAIFITHEIQFFQGIAKAFSISYHNVDVRQKTIRISESAVSWIHRRSPNVTDITVYMVEPDGKGKDYILRKMMNTGHKGAPNILKKPPRLERRDNLFRDYLFKCVDNSESVTADAYGERHLAIPLRDDEGLAIVVIDISIGSLKQLPRNENREVMKMLKLLQMAYKEIARESRDGDRQDGDQNRENDAEILFDRLMLLELKENVAKLDQKAYAELKSYMEPPHVIHQIIRSVLSIFHPDLAKAGEFDNWGNCKQYVTPQLSQRILSYDPTSDDDPQAEDIPIDLIHQYLEDVPHGQVHKQGSIPAQFLYNWVFVCESLIEHSRKMRRNKKQNLGDQEQLLGNTKREKPRVESPNEDDDAPERKSSPTETEAS